MVPVKFRFVSGVFRLQTSDAPAFPGSLRILPGKIRAAGMYIHASFPNLAKSVLFENDLAIFENYFKDISILQRYLCKKIKKYINNIIKKPVSSA